MGIPPLALNASMLLSKEQLILGSDKCLKAFYHSKEFRRALFAKLQVPNINYSTSMLLSDSRRRSLAFN